MICNVFPGLGTDRKVRSHNYKLVRVASEWVCVCVHLAQGHDPKVKSRTCEPL